MYKKLKMIHEMYKKNNLDRYKCEFNFISIFLSSLWKNNDIDSYIMTNLSE